MSNVKDRRVIEFSRRVKSKFNIEKLILFGSRARQDNLVESDYDFIVVSKDFEGVFFTKRPEMLYDFWEHDVAVELLCYSPKEFEKKRKQISIVAEAVREGVEVG